MNTLILFFAATFVSGGHLYGVYRDLVRPTRLEDDVDPDLSALADETPKERQDRGFGDLQTAKAHLLSADGQIAMLRRGTLGTLLGMGLRDREVKRMEAVGDVLLAETALAVAAARLDIELDTRVGVELDGPMTVLRREMPAGWLLLRLMAPAPLRGTVEVLRGHGALKQAQARIAELLDAVQVELEARKASAPRRIPLAERVPMAERAPMVA